MLERLRKIALVPLVLASVWVMFGCTSSRTGFEPSSEGSLAIHRLDWKSSNISNAHSLLRTSDERYLVFSFSGQEQAAWEVLPDSECVALRKVPSAQAEQARQEELARYARHAGTNDEILPPRSGCPPGFEGSCISRDGRLRIFTRFEGTREVRRIHGFCLAFCDGGGWADRTFYTGRRILGFEDLITGKRALFIERLNDSVGYHGSDLISYLPELKAVLVIGIWRDKEEPTDYCIRLDP